MQIPRRTLGRTGLEVSTLGYGAMEVRGPRIWDGRHCSDEQAAAVLSAVVDAGINFIDTSNDYGMSEIFIGRFLAERRKEYFLATKCGCHVQFAGDHDETRHVFTRDNLLRGFAESLQKLRRDSVDLLQLHNPDVEVCESAGLVEVLREFQAAGAVRFIGCSSTSPHLKTYIGWGVFDVFQVPYSALDRRHENVISEAGEAGAGVIVRGGVARGEPGTGRGAPDQWATFEKANLDELREDGESRTAFMLRFTLSHPHCHTTIVGTLSPDHLQENVRAACRGPLPPDVYREAAQRLDAAGVRPED